MVWASYLKSKFVKTRYVITAILATTFSVVLVMYQNFTSLSSSLPLGSSPFHIQDVSDKDFSGLNFNPLVADFNGDNIDDTLNCSNIKKNITIIDGADSKNIKTVWAGPKEWTTPSYAGFTKTFSFTGCSIVRLNGLNHIVVSTLLSHQRDGARVRSPQYVLINQGNMDFKLTEIRVPNTQGGFVFRAASRSVKCQAYPAKLVEAGYAPGVLCFFAGYDAGGQDWAGYGTNTALLKLELKSNGDLIVKDLTASSGLPWRGGAYGTDYRVFPIVGGKYENLHMMDSAFSDLDSDGYVDLVTVAQHANMYFSRMIPNKNLIEGVQFLTSRAVGTGYEPMTEYLRVTAFNEVHRSLASLKCFFMSGENEGGARSVHDHIRCYENNIWKRYELPGKKGFSWSGRGFVAADGDGKLILKTTQVTDTTRVVKQFAINYTGPMRYNILTHQNKSVLSIKGFACLQNSMEPFKILISNGDLSKGGKLLSSTTTVLPQTAKAGRICLQSNNPNATPNFEVKLPLESVKSVNPIYVYSVDSSGKRLFLRTVSVK